MTWALVIGLAAAAMAVLLLVFRLPRGTREAAGSALLLGIAGYVMQGSPGLGAVPKAATETVAEDRAALVEGRAKITNSGIPTNDRWVVIADALARNGRYADAAEVLRGAIEADPRNADAWLALANALVAHAGGALTPPARYAYDRAIEADAKAPGPRFFLGLAHAREGKLAQARALWLQILREAPEDAPWRLPLARQLMQLDAIIAAQEAQSASPESR